MINAFYSVGGKEQKFIKRENYKKLYANVENWTFFVTYVWNTDTWDSSQTLLKKP